MGVAVVFAQTLELHGAYGDRRDLGFEKLVRDAACFILSDGVNRTLLLKAAQFIRAARGAVADLGLRGVQIGTTMEQVPLDDRRFDEFFATAVDHGFRVRAETRDAICAGNAMALFGLPRAVAAR